MINDVMFKYNSNKSISAFDEWGLVLTDVENTLPEPKLTIVDLRGSDGVIDLSETLTGDVRYNNRKLTLTFALSDVKDYNLLMSSIANEIHGLTMDIQLTSDDMYYYTGRVTIPQWRCSKQKGIIVIDVDAKPFKCAVSETTYTLKITKQETHSIKCESRTKVCPRLWVDGNITISNDDFSVTLTTGEHIVPDIVIKNTTENKYTFDGRGTIKFIYRAEVL